MASEMDGILFSDGQIFAGISTHPTLSNIERALDSANYQRLSTDADSTTGPAWPNRLVL